MLDSLFATIPISQYLSIHSLLTSPFRREENLPILALACQCVAGSAITAEAATSFARAGGEMVRKDVQKWWI